MGQLILRTSVVAGGAIVDGTSYNVTGPAVAVPTTVEGLGFKNGIIDSGTPGNVFTRANWSRGFPGECDWRWSTTRTLSRTRALRFDPAGLNSSPDNGRGTYTFDHGASGLTQEYFSCNYYWTMTNACQWKLRRGNYIDDVVDGQDPSWYTSCNTQSGFNIFLNVFNQNVVGNPIQDASAGVWPNGTWFRCQIFFTVNSPAGTANGTWRLVVTRISDGAVIQDYTFSGINFKGNAPAVGIFRYSVMQNYLGNSLVASHDHGNCIIDMDDIYLSSVASGTGAFVRAELCNNATFASATKTSGPCKINSIGGTTWNVEANQGPNSISDYTHWALFNAANTPTMVAV